MIKVLFQTYNTCFQNASGGVNIRFNKLYNGLLDSEICVKKFDKYTDKIEDYDVLHIFHLDVESLELVKCAKRLGKKVVISSVVNIVGHKKLLFYKFLNIVHLQTYYRSYRSILMMSDVIIAETESEKRFISKYYGIKSCKIVVIPNGVDQFSYSGDDIFDIWNGKKQKYILQVGRFDKNKNQINVIKSFKNTDIQVVFIGGAGKAENHYFEKCLRLANDSNNIHFLGWLDHDSKLLASAFCNASVLILPSYMETFGMVLIEGAAAGASVAISKTLPIINYDVFLNCPIFNPNNPDDIKNKTMYALNHPQVDLKKKVLSFFSWKRIIRLHIDIYEKLLCDVKEN